MSGSNYVLADIYSLYNASALGRDTCHLGTRCTGSNNLAFIEPSFCDIGCVAFITIMSIVGFILLVVFATCMWRSRRRYEIAANIGFASSDEEENIRQTGDIRKGTATDGDDKVDGKNDNNNKNNADSTTDEKKDGADDAESDNNNKPNCCQTCMIQMCSPPDFEEEDRKRREEEEEFRQRDPVGAFINKIKVGEDVDYSQIHVASRSVLQHCKAFQFSSSTFISCIKAAHNYAKDPNRDQELEKLFVLAEMGKVIADRSRAKGTEKMELCFGYRLSQMGKDSSVDRDELVSFQKKLFESIDHFETLWTALDVAQEARNVEDVDSLNAKSKMSEPMGCLFAYAISLREYDSKDRLSRACQLGFTPSQSVRLEKEIKTFSSSSGSTFPTEITRSQFIQAYQAAFEDSSVYPNYSILNRLFVLSTDTIPTRRLLNSVSQEADAQSRSFVQYFTTAILLRTKYANELALYIPYLILFTVFMLFGLGYDEAYEMHESITQQMRWDKQPNVDVNKFPRSCSPNCKFYESYFMAFDEIAFIADLTDWIDGVFIPNLWPFDDLPASSFKFNGVVPVGALKIRQVRSDPYADRDQSDAYFASKNPTAAERATIANWFGTNESKYPSLGLVHPPFTGSTEWKEDFKFRNDIFNDASLDESIKLAFKYRDGAALNGSGIYNGKNIFISPGGFALMVPMKANGATAKNLIDTLFNKNWVDMSTRAIIFELYFYNNQLHILHRTRMIFETTVGGLYIPYIDGTAVKLFNPGSHSFGFFIFLAIFFVYVFFYIVPMGFISFFWTIPMAAMKRRREEGPAAYFNSLKTDSIHNSWCLMLLLNSIVQLITWIIRLVQFTYTTTALGNDLFQADYLPSSYSTLASTATASYYTSALAIAFAYFIPLYYLTYQNDGLAVVKRTVQRAVAPLLSLVVVSVMMLAAFAVCAFIAYGSVLPDYRDPAYSLGQVLLAVLGEYDYDEWRQVHLSFSAVFFFILTVLLEILLLNMVVSILIDAFDDEMDCLFDEEGTKLLIQNDPFVQVPFPTHRDQFKASPFYNGFMVKMERMLAYFKEGIHRIEQCLKIDPRNCFVHPEFSLHHALEAIESHDHYIFWQAMNDSIESIQFGSFAESFAGQFHICTQLMPMVDANFDDLASVLLSEDEETNLGEGRKRHLAGGKFTSTQTGVFDRRRSSVAAGGKMFQKNSSSDASSSSDDDDNNNKSNSSSPHLKPAQSVGGASLSSSSSDDDDDFDFDEDAHKTLKTLIAEKFGQVRTTLLLFQAMPNYHLGIPSAVLLLTALETRHRWGQEIEKFTVRCDQDEPLDPRSACLELESLSNDLEDAIHLKKMLRLKTDPTTGEQAYTTVKKVLPRRQTKQVLLPIVTEKEKERLMDVLEPMMEADSHVDGISTLEFTKAWNNLRIGMAKTRAQQTFYRGKKSLEAENSKQNASKKKDASTDSDNDDDDDDDDDAMKRPGEDSSQVIVEGVYGDRSKNSTSGPSTPLDPNAATVSRLDTTVVFPSTTGEDKSNNSNNGETAPAEASTTTTAGSPSKAQVRTGAALGEGEKKNQAQVAKTVLAAASSTADVNTDASEIIQTTQFLFPTREEYRAQPEDFFDVSEIVNGVEYMGRSTVEHFLNECVQTWGERRRQWLAIRWTTHRVAEFMSTVRKKNPNFNFDQLIIPEPEPGYTLDGKIKLPPVGLGKSKFMKDRYKSKAQLRREHEEFKNSSTILNSTSSPEDSKNNKDRKLLPTTADDDEDNNNQVFDETQDEAEQGDELQAIPSVFVAANEFEQEESTVTTALPESSTKKNKTRSGTDHVDNVLNQFAATADDNEEEHGAETDDDEEHKKKNKKSNRNKHALTIPSEFIAGWKAAQGTSHIPQLVQRALVGTTYEEFFAAATKNSRQSLTFFDLVSVYMARDSSLFFNTMAYLCFVVLFTVFACSNRAIGELVWFTEGTKESYATQQFVFQSLDNGINSTTTGPNIVDSQFINVHDVQNWIQFVEQIVFEGAYAEPNTGTAQYVSQTNQETPIGSIVIRQLRKKKTSCVGELDPLRPVNKPDLTVRTDLAGRAAVLEPSCVDHDSEETSAFGNAATLSSLDPLVQEAFKHRSCEQLGLVGSFLTDYNNIGCDGYALVLPISESKTNVTNLFQSLIGANWIDDQTYILAVNLVTFNYNLNYFARWRYFLQITRGGEVFPEYDVNLVRPWIPGQQSLAYKVFLGFFYLSILVQAAATISTMVDDYRREKGIGSTRWVAFVRMCTDDTWWILNLSNVMILLVLWSWRFSTMVESTDDIFIFKPKTAARIEELAETQVIFDLIEAASAILTYFRVAYYLRSFPSLNLLARTLFIATTEIWSLVVIFVIVFLGFGISAFFIVGPVVFNFSTVELALGTLFRGLLGADVDFDSMIELHPIWTGVFYTCFIIACEFVLFNLIIAVLNDSLEKARNETADTEPFEIAVVQDSRSGNALRYKKFEHLGPLAYVLGVIYTEGKFKLQKLRNFFAKYIVDDETWELYEIQTKHHPETFWKTLLVCSQLPNPLRAYMRWTQMMRKTVGAHRLPETKPYPESHTTPKDGDRGLDALSVSPTVAMFEHHSARVQNVLVPSNFTKIISDFDIKESYDDDTSHIDQSSPFSLLENINNNQQSSCYFSLNPATSIPRPSAADDDDTFGGVDGSAPDLSPEGADDNNDDNDAEEEDLLRVRRVDEALRDKLGEVSNRALNLSIFAHVVTNLPTTIMLTQMMQRRHEYLTEREDFDGRNLNQVVRLSKRIVRQLRDFENTPVKTEFVADSSASAASQQQQQQARSMKSKKNKNTYDEMIDDLDSDIGDDGNLLQSGLLTSMSNLLREVDVKAQQDNTAAVATTTGKTGKITQQQQPQQQPVFVAKKIRDAADSFWEGKIEGLPQRDFEASPIACPMQSQAEHKKNQEESEHRINLSEVAQSLFAKKEEENDDENKDAKKKDDTDDKNNKKDDKK